MLLLKQSTAKTVVLGPFVDDSDGKSPETTLTISQADIRLSKNGGAFAQTNNSAGATHMENGYYSVPLDTTDTNTVGTLTVAISESGALPVFREFMVVPANVYDSLVAGTDTLQADVTQVGGDTQSATDLKDFADTGYDPSTHKVQGVVLTDTCDALATQAKADVNAEVDNALNTDIPGSPTANSINERIKAIDDKLPSGTISDFDNSSDQVIVGTNNDKTGYSISGTKTTLDALNDISTADVNSEVDTALADIGLDHLVGASVTGTDVVDNSIVAKLVSKSGTADWDDFDNTTDSLEAIRDRGDAAWTTGSGTGLTALASGTAQDGGNNTITLAAGESSTNDIYKGARIALVGGTGSGQARIITAYNGSTKEATVSPNWVTNPNSSTDYEIQAADSTLGTIQNDVQSVTDLKDLVDTGYDPSAHKIQGVGSKRYRT